MRTGDCASASQRWIEVGRIEIMAVTCADVLAGRGRKIRKSDSASVVCNANVETDLSSHPMNRPDIVELLAERFAQLTQRDVDSAVASILDAMNGALVQGHRIELRGFGSFSVIYRAPTALALHCT